MFGFFWQERKQYFLLQFSVMGLRNVQGFEQMTTSGPVPASEARQNGARRHSHSFRPLHDVGGIKAPPPTLPQKEPGGNARGMVVYRSAFLSRLSCLPFPVLTSSYSLSQLSVGACRGIALLSNTHTHTHLLDSEGERGKEGEGDGEMWCGDSRVISLYTELRRRTKHGVKQRLCARGDMV